MTERTLWSFKMCVGHPGCVTIVPSVVYPREPGGAGLNCDKRNAFNDLDSHAVSRAVILNVAAPGARRALVGTFAAPGRPS